MSGYLTYNITQSVSKLGHFFGSEPRDPNITVNLLMVPVDLKPGSTFDIELRKLENPGTSKRDPRLRKIAEVPSAECEEDHPTAQINRVGHENNLSVTTIVGRPIGKLKRKTPSLVHQHHEMIMKSGKEDVSAKVKSQRSRTASMHNPSQQLSHLELIPLGRQKVTGWLNNLTTVSPAAGGAPPLAEIISERARPTREETLTKIQVADPTVGMDATVSGGREHLQEHTSAIMVQAEVAGVKVAGDVAEIPPSNENADDEHNHE
ncbi:hypothetical protein HDU93_009964 [Gonapodya sp. JEL0774]|nr:hypothetical protein HDU93_009964 [Gonapodya sp. JEL0774]